MMGRCWLFEMTERTFLDIFIGWPWSFVVTIVKLRLYSIFHTADLKEPLPLSSNGGSVLRPIPREFLHYGRTCHIFSWCDDCWNGLGRGILWCPGSRWRLVYINSFPSSNLDVYSMYVVIRAVWHSRYRFVRMLLFRLYDDMLYQWCHSLEFFLIIELDFHLLNGFPELALSQYYCLSVILIRIGI